MSLKPLGPLDQMFLWLDRRHQPMQVGVLELLRPPEGAPPEWLSEQVERLRSATQAQPPFNLRPTRKMGSWFWTEDEDFDLEAHFRHLALPAPGRIRELLTLISQLHSAPLDRGRPLWEFYLISGVEDGRFAIYAKIHHAVVDGVAAMRLLRKSMSENPNDPLVAPWTLARRARPAPPVDVALTSTAKIIEALRGQASTVPAVVRELNRTIREARDNPDLVSAFQAPRSLFNQPITGSRRFAAQSYSLPRIRAAMKTHQASQNDIVLAMCASALRRYLLDHEALPAKPLIAMVPMSLRRDDSEEGNQIALLLANLGTHLADPLQRLATIKGSTQDAKQRFQRMGAKAMLAYIGAIMAPTGLNLISGLAPRWQAFNVVISNVPGPKRPLYFNGARCEGMYPASILTDGIALNITLTSYTDHVEFGVIACRRTLPRIQKLLQYFEDGLAELEVPPLASEAIPPPPAALPKLTTKTVVRAVAKKAAKTAAAKVRKRAAAPRRKATKEPA